MWGALRKPYQGETYALVQQYAPVGGVVASACLAAIPLIILFYMLAVRKARCRRAAAAGLIGALIVAGGRRGICRLLKLMAIEVPRLQRRFPGLFTLIV